MTEHYLKQMRKYEKLEDYLQNGLDRILQITDYWQQHSINNITRDGHFLVPMNSFFKRRKYCCSATHNRYKI